MLYLKSDDGKVRVVVLDTANLEALRAGRPASTADGEVLIAWTADPVWLADKIMDVPDGDVAAIAAIIDESARRPQKPVGRPTHKPHLHQFGGET